MRVALVTHKIESGEPGGAGRSLLSLVEHTRGIEFTAFVPKEDAMSTQLADRGVNVEIVPFRNCFVHGPNALTKAVRSMKSIALNRRAVRVIARGLADRRIDLVHSNSLMVDVGFDAARRAGVPHLWHIREIMSDQHGQPILGRNRFRTKVLRSDGCVAVSATAAGALWPKGAEGSRIRDVIYNGVFSSQEIACIEGARLSAEPSADIGPKICIIGGVQPAKGQDIAISAVALLRRSGIPAELEIAGGGNLEWARSVCEAEGVSDSVRFLGRVGNPWEVLGASHMCLICSEAEAMGRVAAEALVSGTPVVATHGGATDELLDHGARGSLVNRDAGDVAAVIERIWVDYVAAKAKAEAMVTWAREVFSVEAYTMRLCEVYSRLAGRDFADISEKVSSDSG